MTNSDMIIVGAGSVGLSLGGRLAAAGAPVTFVVRRREQAARLSTSGVHIEDPATGESVSAPVRATTLEEVPHALHRQPAFVLVCTRATDTASVAPRLGAVFPDSTLVSVQNDVDNEAELARHSSHVIGAVWRQTCTRWEDHVVRALGLPRVVIGAYPEGDRGEVEELAAQLRAAHLDVGVSPHIQRDKWLKLAINLMSAPNALVRPAEHTSAAFVEGKARLLEEARAIFDSLGILAESCDGRDRSLPAEIDFQRQSLARGTSARRVPVYNQVWRALRERTSNSGAPNPLEADAYHARFISLGQRARIPTPQNTHVLAQLQRAWTERLGPECYGAEEMLAE